MISDRILVGGTLANNESRTPPRLEDSTSDILRAYFQDSWSLNDILFSSLDQESTFYLSPDPLRNPLIFYLGHTAAFYINKLVMAGLLDEGINSHYEEIFAKGVDPASVENLDVKDVWPSVDEVYEYREKVFNAVMKIIEEYPDHFPVDEGSPYWAVHMGIEHDRIHFETSSVLIRQLPEHLVTKPEDWKYAPSNGIPPKNEFASILGGEVIIGKTDHSEFGWDNEYGTLKTKVDPFRVTRNLISNHEYLEFVQSGAYDDLNHWTEKGKEWKTQESASYPKFWVKTENSFQYRAMFDIIDMPLDWPVEVNAHEAEAYCNWKGGRSRLMFEREFKLISLASNINESNLNVEFGSPSPVGYFNQRNEDGINDIFGNVWDWLSDDFYPLPGFKTHPLYRDFSEPYFDDDHAMLLGGAWATTGTGANEFYRLWFRRFFFQHAGFRIAQSI